MSYIANVVVLLFVLLGLLHVYWAAGGRYGIKKAVPQLDGKPVMEPGALITLLVALALWGLAYLVYVLNHHELNNMRYGQYIIYVGWLASAVFIMRAIGDFKFVGFFKKVKSSEFAMYDTKYYSPLCLGLGCAIAALAFHQT